MLNKALPLSLALMSAVPAWAANNEDVPANEDTAARQIARMIEEQG